VRKTGVDPLGISVVALPDMTARSPLGTLGAGAIACHRSFRGAAPEHAGTRGLIEKRCIDCR